MMRFGPLDRENRYCVAVNVIGFLYAGFQVCWHVIQMKKGKPVIGRPAGDYFDFAMDQSSVSRAKRGFSDSVDGSGKWGFTRSGRSEVGLGKSGVLLSPRGELGGGRVAGLGDSAPRGSQERKEQVVSGGAAPAANLHGASLPAAGNRIAEDDGGVHELIKTGCCNYLCFQLLMLLLLLATVDSDAAVLFLVEEYKRNMLPNLHSILKNSILS